MNRLIMISISAIFLMTSCSNKTKSAISKKGDNMVMEICSCKNSKNYTIDDYSQIESRKLNLEHTQYVQDFFKLKSKDQYWVRKFFFEDQFFVEKIYHIRGKYQGGSRKMSEKEWNALVFSTKKKYPFCANNFDFFLEM